MATSNIDYDERLKKLLSSMTFEQRVAMLIRAVELHGVEVKDRREYFRRKKRESRERVLMRMYGV